MVLTGSDDVDVANESFEHGASGYVVKPFTPNELLMQVSSALRRRDLERSVADHVVELERKVIESTTGISALRAQLETSRSDRHSRTSRSFDTSAPPCAFATMTPGGTSSG